MTYAAYAAHRRKAFEPRPQPLPPSSKTWSLTTTPPLPPDRSRMLSSISKLLPTNINLNPFEGDLFKSSHPTSSRTVIDSAKSEDPHQGDQQPPSQSHHPDTTTHEKTQSDAADATAQPGKRRRKDPASSEVSKHGNWLGSNARYPIHAPSWRITTEQTVLLRPACRSAAQHADRNFSQQSALRST